MTAYNSPTYGETGKIGNGMSFGSTGGISSTNYSALTPSGPVYSISAWVKLNTLPSAYGRDYTIVRGLLSGDPWENMVFRVDSTNAVTLRFTSASDNNYTTTSATLTTGGTWYHCVAVITGIDNVPIIYINNTAYSGSTAQIANIGALDYEFDIGNTYSGDNQAFDGVIDEVGVWRKALSAAEVNSLYDYGIGKTYPFAEVTPTVTPSKTPSLTPSKTPSTTPSVTPTITLSITPTITLSVTPTVSPSITPSISVSPSITPSTTPSITPSITLTPSSTPSLTPSITPSITPTITPTQSFIPRGRSFFIFFE